MMHWTAAMASELPRKVGEREREVREVRLEDLERLARVGRTLPLREWLALAEAWRIAQALREHRGNRAATARALGIGRRTLFTKMDKLGLVPSWGVVASELPPREL
ncbi:MAG TPA: helix-turn-helix domain-containing protein [Myxococcota bacterium]|nr:helix-turn-helix domain-containing protein [Myxococcota bacterium]